jgi:glycosyltransferase involved in cell wall biosynthesis
VLVNDNKKNESASRITLTNHPHEHMNICIITSSFPSHPDDIVQAPFLIDFIEGLKKREHRVFLFTQDRKGVKEAFLEGVQIKWFPWMKTEKPLVRLNPMNPLHCLRIGNLFYNGKKALLPFVKKNKINACLALWVLPSGYFANHAYRRNGIPYSIWALGSDIYRYGRTPFLYPMMKRIIQGAKGVFADGFDLSRRVEERFGRKCFFLATTRKLPPLPPLAKGRAGGLVRRPYCFLFVGRLERVKGVDLLLQSMWLLIKEELDIHLTLVGSGSMEDWARNFVSQRGLRRFVTLKGNVDDETLASLYTLSDCVVIPSRSESIPLVFSEALNFDKELIVTDVGDMGMLGRQYGAAWVIPPEDRMALKEMMKKRVESQENEKTASHASGVDHGKRAELKQLFNIETSVERFLEDYK